MKIYKEDPPSGRKVMFNECCDIIETYKTELDVMCEVSPTFEMFLARFWEVGNVGVMHIAIPFDQAGTHLPKALSDVEPTLIKLRRKNRDEWPESFAAMESKPLTPKVGIGVVVARKKANWQVLLGKRQGSHGAGKLSLPGGHLELGESPEGCSQREVVEEAGILLPKDGMTRIGFGNNVMPDESLHYVTLFLGSVVKEDTIAENREPDKNDEWLWFDEADIPDDLFGDASAMIASYIAQQKAKTCPTPSTQ